MKCNLILSLRRRAFSFGQENLRLCRGLLEFDGFGEHLSHRSEGGLVSPHPCPLHSHCPHPQPLSHPMGEGSRGEGERCPAMGRVRARRIGQVAVEVSPLLGGEGRGEGETDDPTAGCVPIVASAGGWPEAPNGFEPYIVSSLRLCRRSLTLVTLVRQK